MDSFGAVRARAAEEHRLSCAVSADGKAASVLSAAREREGLSVKTLPRAHPLLGGGDGALRRESKVIYIADHLADDVAAFVEAHEFGHYWLETPDDPAVVRAGADPGGPERGTPLGLNRVEDYSPEELRERYANVFGREFLLPRHEARRLFIEDKLTAPDIARALVIPVALVRQQLAAALLLPPDRAPSPDAPKSPKERPELDPSQLEASRYSGAPLLVEAGPGTGKTRTLVARIEHLLKLGVAPSSILALTFSNKAAREIRERVAATMPEAAVEIWAGTFHAFGLELLRKHGSIVDVAQPVKLLDQSDQMEMLESDLSNLGLDHYLRLYEPLADLKYILTAISRAKDDVVSPAEYAIAADKMHRDAKTDDDLVKAEKAREVAGVFKRYDHIMRDKGQVDFADLVSRPLEIFEREPTVLEALRAKFTHILVDEYQDVNLASAKLVKELAGDGANLWVVGDARQSIYRFRGAAPTNTRDFENDYPAGVRRSLKINYRSRKEIVDAFCGFAGVMSVGRGKSVALTANRGASPGAIDFNVALDRPAEIQGIASQIRRYRDDGIPFREQAVLCRTHTHLERIAAGLEAAAIPILYLGDLFERPEVRDMLALISFVAEHNRGGLFRVATLPPYKMQIADVRTFLANASKLEIPPRKALDVPVAMNGVSDGGRVSLRKFSEDLKGIEFRTGPGAMLCQLLFDHRGLLDHYLVGDVPIHQQRRLALHQILQFAVENDQADDGDPKRRMLDWIRRLESFGDERALREPPAAIDGIDAVRLMTVHASKGLEFQAVHMPVLGKGMFPLKRQGQRCPPPPDMLKTVSPTDHDEEEDCLFFVALSRARDRLSLSRAERYSDATKSNPSDPVIALSAHLPRPLAGGATWTHKSEVDDGNWSRDDLKVDHADHDGRDIETYLRCPRQYLYQQVLNLGKGREDNAYVLFHRAVYAVLNWMRDTGHAADQAEFEATFEREWMAKGLHNQPLEPLYRDAANRILAQAQNRRLDDVSLGQEVALSLGGAIVRVPIDEVDRTGGRLVLRRLRTGRPPKKGDDRPLHAIMLEAGRQTLGQNATFEVHYLTTDTTVSIPFDRVMTSRIEATRNALSDMANGRFPATPDNKDDCPRCPHYFICPSVPD